MLYVSLAVGEGELLTDSKERHT
jgi:hypothetical protein